MCRSGYVKMWNVDVWKCECGDVEMCMWRCVDVEMSRCGDVDVWKCECGDVEMWMWRCGCLEM